MTNRSKNTASSVIVVVPWYGGSHRAWADGWRSVSRHRIELVATAPRTWRHRMLSGTAELADELEAAASRHGTPDVVVVSSLTDTAALLGLARRAVGDAAIVQYQHESQLLHPSLQPGDRHLVDIEWRSMAAADAVWFNSDFHRNLYLSTCPHDTSSLAARSSTMPVGVDLSQIAVDRRPASDPSRSVRLLFNQRWDADKRPQRVVAALASAAAAGARFEVVLAGEQPPDDDRGLLSACERLGQRVVHAGTATRSRYLELLHTCDAVVGDPLHEFFGVAAVEAMAAGCHPLLPQALSYPALVDHPQRLLHRSHDLVAQIITFCADPPAPDATLAAHVRRFDWSRIGPLYDEAIAGLAR